MAAIVTGGAQGIGASICVELLKNGYKVCVADIQKDKGLQFVEEQQKIFGSENVIFSWCDVRKESEYTRTFEEAVSAFQKVDVLINDAGISRGSPKDVIDVNLMGPIVGCQVALKYMGKSNGGTGGMVIVIASLVGIVPVWREPVYAASKHGVIGLVRSYGLPENEQRDGVLFAAVCPGLTKTDLIKPSKEGDRDLSQRSDAMCPDYVAQGVMKVLEDRINGSTLVVTKALGYRYIEYQKEIDNIPLFNLKL